ncbi:MAG: tRNA (adenosine(37)-N6)-threonylcarbamoyltransferase complex transferase subunit TsaD [Dehalococcoidia bacterium]
MRILGIETSCDETAAAVVEDGRRLLASAIASQASLHARYGGIVPEVASRQHVEAAVPVVQAALAEAHCTWEQIEAVAVTHGPGLAGSLLVGVGVAKAIAFARSLPLIGINHLEAHIDANWLEEGPPPELPALCLIVSGGHTDMVVMEDHGRYRRLGRTLDDAAGEAFDKVARLLGLGFPGGPAIEQEAAMVESSRLHLPRAWLRGSHDFSFSGLKTAVVRLARGEEGEMPSRPEVAAAFQEAVTEVIATKAANAARQQRVATIMLAGGVAANQRLRTLLRERSPVPVRVPRPSLCTDNGAMVAAGAYFHLTAGESHGLDLDVVPGLRIG